MAGTKAQLKKLLKANSIHHAKVRGSELTLSKLQISDLIQVADAHGLLEK